MVLGKWIKTIVGTETETPGQGWTGWGEIGYLAPIGIADAEQPVEKCTFFSSFVFFLLRCNQDWKRTFKFCGRTNCVFSHP